MKKEKRRKLRSSRPELKFPDGSFFAVKMAVEAFPALQMRII
jgi:hypothetical protein